MRSKNRSLFISILLSFSIICSTLLMFMSRLPSQAAPGGSIVVNTPADTDDGVCDSADCTLREAINATNSATGADTIAFALLPGLTITLNGSQMPTISDTVTIDGSTVQSLTISGASTSRIFQIGSDTAVTLTNLIISDGQVGCNACSPTNGGGIYNDGGTLTVINSTFRGNSVTDLGNGGSIYNDGGQVIVRNSSFIGNGAFSYEGVGGAIYNNGGELIVEDSIFLGNITLSGGGAVVNNVTGTLTIKDSAFTANVISHGGIGTPFGGGAIRNEGRAVINNTLFDNNESTSLKGVAGGALINTGSLTVTNSVFSGNSASGSGGAISNQGSLTMSGCEISNNSVSGSWSGGAGGGVLNWGSATIVNSTIEGNTVTRMPVFAIPFDNSGGGIVNFGLLNLISSTVNDNSVTGLADDIVTGGGITNDSPGEMNIINSTISGNSLFGLEDGIADGGGIFNASILTLTNSTVNNNSAVINGLGLPAGGGLNNSGALYLGNTIVANSLDGGDCVNSGTIVTSTANLVEDGSYNPALSGDPLLGPLQSNGGQTSTHLPLPGSLAIDNGDNEVCEVKDQRGIPRPIDGDDNEIAVCDIGSVEVGGRFMLMPIVFKAG